MQLYKILSSSKLAFLIIALILLYCLGVAIIGVSTGTYSMDLFQMWPLRYLLIGLLINTFFCTLRQIIIRVRFIKRTKHGGKAFRWARATAFDNEQEALTWLRSKGYSRYGLYTWSKRTYGLAFIILFHIAFILIGLGYFASYLFRVEALVPITDGEELYLNSENFSHYGTARYGRLDIDDWYVRISNIGIHFPKKGWPHDIQADFELWEKEELVIKDRLKRVPPIKYKGIEFNTFDFSYAPYMIVSKSGRPLIEAFISLSNDELNGQTTVADEVFLSDGSLLKIEFFPRGKNINWGRTSEYQFPNDPHVMISFDSEANLLLKLGKTKKYKEYEVTFVDYRYVVHMKILDDKGMTVILYAFSLGLIGLVGHYLFTPSFASLSREGQEWQVYQFDWSNKIKERVTKDEL